MKLKTIFFILILCLLLLPFFLWGNTYLVGGDDTRLYYIFPYQFLSNYTFNIISDNTLAGAMTGYASVSYFAPFFYIILIAKFIPFVSTQMLLYGLNFALGFVGFYLFLGLWMDKKNTSLIRIFGSIFYVSSIYIMKTLYINQLLSIYLVSALPLTSYLFVRGLQENKKSFIIYSIAIFSLLSTTINTLPWWGAFLIASIPVFIWLAVKYQLSFIKAGLLAGGVFLVLNVFWIFHFLYSYFFNTGLHSTLQYYSSKDFIKDNLRIIFGVSTLYNPLNVVFQQMNTNFLTNFSFFSVLGVIFFLPILVTGLVLKSLSKEKRIIYGIVLGSFILSWFLFSPGFGEKGPQIFLYLGEHVPFFTMFRNMYDKFAFSVAFYFAFALTYSLYLLRDKMVRRHSILVLATVFVSIVVFAIRSFYILQNDTATYTHFSGKFNNDFVQLTHFLQEQPDASKVLWLPLDQPTYVNVTDKYNQDTFYSGLSPLRILSNRSDFAGRYSFFTQNNLFLGDYVFALLRNKQYTQFLSLLQKLNISYIIVDKQQLPKDLRTFMYGGEKEEILQWQDKKLVQTVVGEKIKDFGSRYSLYKINQAYASEKIYLTNDFTSFPQNFTNLHYVKNTSASYDISITHLITDKKMVFLDPYYKDWTLYVVANGKKVPFEEGKNQLVFGYANGWNISPENIKKNYQRLYTTNDDGSINLHMQLYFKPDKYSIYADTLSLVGWIIVVVLLGWESWSVVKKRK